MELKHLSSTKLSFTLNGSPCRLKYFYKKLFPVDDRHLIMVSNTKECLCFDMVEQKVLWVDVDTPKHSDYYSFVTHEHTVLHNGVLYSGRANKDLVAMEAATGNILWTFYAGSGSDTFNSDFAFYEDKAILFHSKRSVSCVDMKTHKLLWKLKFTADLGYENGVLWNGYYVVQSVSRNTPTINYINLHTGELERQVKLTSKYTNTAEAVGMSYDNIFPWGDKLWYKSKSGHMCCFDLAKGERIEVAFTGCECTDSWAIGSSNHIILNNELYMNAVGGGLEHGWYKFGEDMQLKLIALTNNANMSGFGYYSGSRLVNAFTDRKTNESMVNTLDLFTGAYQRIDIPMAVSLECAMLHGNKLILTDSTGNGEVTLHMFSVQLS